MTLFLFDELWVAAERSEAALWPLCLRGEDFFRVCRYSRRDKGLEDRKMRPCLLYLC
jgi:hypothetical protein